MSRDRLMLLLLPTWISVYWDCKGARAEILHQFRQKFTMIGGHNHLDFWQFDQTKQRFADAIWISGQAGVQHKC